MKLLAGDLGGTKTHLALYEKTDDQYRLLHEKRYPSANYPHLYDILQAFAQETQVNPKDLQGACIGVAGPVEQFNDGQMDAHQRSKITNLPWEVDSREIQAHTGIEKIKLANDFQIIGYGIDALQPSDLVTLFEGTPEGRGNRVFLGAGTGLGTGFGIWNDKSAGHQIFASEGGHMDFAPCSEDQRWVLDYLAKGESHIPYEYLLSGKGLVNIAKALSDLYKSSPKELPALDQHDAPAQITQMAVDGSAFARKVVEVFTQIYAQQCANLALLFLPTNGIYIAGGIAPKIQSFLESELFRNAYFNKGNMTPLLTKFPLYLIKNPDIAILGAAVAASRP